MLVLDRKINQRIVIDGDIWVSVLGIYRDRVKLGFNAPDEVPMLREELVAGKNEPREDRNDEEMSVLTANVGGEDKPRARKKGEGMLVLTRKVEGGGVLIGAGILVKVLGSGRGRAKIGINAPSYVKIEREERITEGRPRGKEMF